MRLYGAKGCSFPPIVAVGARAALPHARPTDQKIGADDFVLVDWGADAGPYKSDLTRVLVTGKISPKLERIYRVVLSAQEQAIAAIRPGRSGHEVDQVARERDRQGRLRTELRPRFGTRHRARYPRRPATGRRPAPEARAGHGGDGRAGNLPAGLGRRANRGRRAGHQGRLPGPHDSSPNSGKTPSWLKHCGRESRRGKFQLNRAAKPAGRKPPDQILRGETERWPVPAQIRAISSTSSASAGSSN